MLDQSQISRIESGRAGVGPMLRKHQRDIAAFFGLPPSAIFPGYED